MQDTNFQRQTCSSCCCEDKFDYHVPPSLWQAVVPKEFYDAVICLECFDKFAAEKGLRYADELSMIYFAGEKAAMKLKVVDAHDP